MAIVVLRIKGPKSSWRPGVLAIAAMINPDTLIQWNQKLEGFFVVGIDTSNRLITLEERR